MDFIAQMLKERKKQVEIARYFILRQLDNSYPIDEEFETHKDEMKDYSSSLAQDMYFFKENFFKTINSNPLESKLEDHAQEAMQYLNASYPFCFNDALTPFLMGQDVVGTDLMFYAMCIGATSEQLSGLKDMLKAHKLKTIDRPSSIQILSSGEKQLVDLTDVSGSTVSNYQCPDFLSAFLAMNDKKIDNYIKYLLKSGALLDPSKVFGGMSFMQDEEGNLFVSEGNHRLVAYRVLKATRDYITGQESPGLSVFSTVQQVRIPGINSDNLER